MDQNTYNGGEETKSSEKKNYTMNDFTILGILGRGAYGEVVLAKRNDDGQQVAIKILDKKFLSKEKKQYQVFIEREVMTIINHPGILKLYTLIQTNDKINFIMEFVEGGDFATFLKNNRNLSFQTIQFYAAEIVSQLEAMHACGIAHRDLKPENILIDQNGHLKMIDFGTAHFFDENKISPETLAKINQLKQISRQDDRTEEEVLDDYQGKHKSTFVGTAEYVSPELLEDDYCSKEADLWALGCIIYKMFVGKTPFQDNTEYLIFQKIKSCQIDLPSNLPPEAVTLFSKLLIREPSIRLGVGSKGRPNSYQELKQHPFFIGIKWDNLWQQKPPNDVKLFDQIKTSNADSSDDEFDQKSKQSMPVPPPSAKQDDKVIFSGIIDKKVGFLIYKERQLIICDGEKPKLIYNDPQTGLKLGEILLTDQITIELDGKSFSIDVPNKKKYKFKQISLSAEQWVIKIKKFMQSKGINARVI